MQSKAEIRHDWTLDDVMAIMTQPFNDLIWQAQTVHRQHFDPNTIQVSTLISIKTGACPEDCKYCPQSGHYNTGVEKEKLIEVERVIKEAKEAKENGASRFCMGAAWKNPTVKDLPYLLEMIKGVKALGLETCMTLGKLTTPQAEALAGAGLDYYNHNLDTSREYYEEIITTRTYEDRLQTLEYVRDAGLKVCAGGIIGMGEKIEDRMKLLMELANLPKHPESVPINLLIKIKGTPLETVGDVDPLDFIRVIATARILMPHSYVRLSAGREGMSDSTQALAFLAGANSIFYGEKLLTSKNAEQNRDQLLFEKLGLKTEKN